MPLESLNKRLAAMLVFIVENIYGTKPAFLPVPFSLGWVWVHGRGRDRNPLVPGGTWWLRPFFKWMNTIFLLSQSRNMLSMVILTMPWVMVSPEEMRKDTVGWLSSPLLQFKSHIREMGRWVPNQGKDTNKDITEGPFSAMWALMLSV